ncbi:DER1-domain-containing protein [Multifurca ochricompacta]|uniref:Derlin n=1 Tax=Multifurca ochricompacta TaxID=376703 RepID=A0AAD4QP31_9AGAM|nr:DER1-domain-containing protein [Multifurca ochricompacta]
MSYTGFWDELRKIPPVTRFLCGSSLAVSVPVMMKLLDPVHVIFLRVLVTQRLEIWRVWSSFFFGGTGLNYVFEIIMLYRSSNTLELERYPRRSPDYAWQLTLAAGAILALNLPLGSFVHSRALTSSLMGLITIPAKYLPHALIGMDLIMGGPKAAAVSVTGAVVGHLWWLVVYGEDGRGLSGLGGLGRAPSWVRALISDGPNVAGTGVHVIPPRQQRQPSARTTGYDWGSSGQRLGSE